jgi:hypothetical protein
MNTKEIIEMLIGLEYSCFSFTIVYLVSETTTRTEQGTTENIEISTKQKQTHGCITAMYFDKK